MIGWLSVGILQYGPLPWKRSVSVFFSLPGNTKRFKAQFSFLLQKYNYSKRNLVLRLPGKDLMDIHTNHNSKKMTILNQFLE